MDVESIIEAVQWTFIVYQVTKLLASARSRRRWWVRELNLTRESEGFYHQSYKRMKTEDPEHFFKITRMTATTFDLLMNLVRDDLKKESLRKAIEPECRVIILLMFLSQAVSAQVIGWMFKIGTSTVWNIIYETCDVIFDRLAPVYLAAPNTHEWKLNADEFERVWNLPNCVSSIDGKHINIECPSNAGSEFFNYKGHHSIVLLAACDANYIFTAFDIGAYGSQSDGGIFAESSFGQRILNETLDLPEPSQLPNTNIMCNYFFVGDNAFPLKMHLMRPYPGRMLDQKKENFNYRLSRARRVIENAFGILVARWRILKTTMTMMPKNVDRIIKTTVVLHNFIKLNDPLYCPPGMVDSTINNEHTPGLWRQQVMPLPSIRIPSSNNSARSAFEMRDTLADYLMANQL